MSAALTAILVLAIGALSAQTAIALVAAGRRKMLKNRLRAAYAEAATPEKKKEMKSLFAAMDGAIRGMSLTSAVKRELAKANWSLKASEFLVMVAMFAALPAMLVLLAYDNASLAVIVMAAGAVFPIIMLKRRQAARKKMFAGQLLDAVTLISNSLKSGYSFLQSIDLVSRELPAPVSEEFQKMIQEIKLGMSFEETVERLVSRVENEDLDLVMTCVNIQREVGGNLSEILDKIAHTIRERVRIKGQIQTLTAQGRLSGMILSLMPVGLGFFLYAINPEYISMLFTRQVGRTLIVAAVTTQLIGIFLIKKIINIKV